MGVFKDTVCLCNSAMPFNMDKVTSTTDWTHTAHNHAAIRFRSLGKQWTIVDSGSSSISFLPHDFHSAENDQRVWARERRKKTFHCKMKNLLNKNSTVWKSKSLLVFRMRTIRRVCATILMRVFFIAFYRLLLCHAAVYTLHSEHTGHCSVNSTGKRIINENIYSFSARSFCVDRSMCVCVRARMRVNINIKCTNEIKRLTIRVNKMSSVRWWYARQCRRVVCSELQLQIAAIPTRWDVALIVMNWHVFFFKTKWPKFWRSELENDNNRNR